MNKQNGKKYLAASVLVVYWFLCGAIVVPCVLYLFDVSPLMSVLWAGAYMFLSNFIGISLAAVFYQDVYGESLIIRMDKSPWWYIRLLVSCVSLIAWLMILLILVIVTIFSPNMIGNWIALIVWVFFIGRLLPKPPD